VPSPASSSSTGPKPQRPASVSPRPAAHFSARLLPATKTLWSSWVINGPRKVSTPATPVTSPASPRSRAARAVRRDVVHRGRRGGWPSTWCPRTAWPPRTSLGLMPCTATLLLTTVAADRRAGGEGADVLLAVPRPGERVDVDSRLDAEARSLARGVSHVSRMPLGGALRMHSWDRSQPSSRACAATVTDSGVSGLLPARRAGGCRRRPARRAGNGQQHIPRLRLPPRAVAAPTSRAGQVERRPVHRDHQAAAHVDVGGHAVSGTM